MAAQCVSVAMCWSLVAAGAAVAVASVGATSAHAPSGAADVVRLSDLPARPEESCSLPSVRSALFSCKLSGPSPSCCLLLDSVFANQSSPSFGCLCLPRVLYSTVTKAAHANLAVLHLLQSCRRNHSTTFKTRWASEINSRCPDIPLHAQAGDLLSALGDAVIVPNSKARGEWSWANILQFAEVMGEVTDLHAISERLFGVKALQLTYLVMISMPVVFLGVHFGLLMPMSSVYRQLHPVDRLVSCQHAVYVVVFSLSLVPQTVLACKSLFYAWTGSYLASNQLTLLVAIFVTTRAVLYVGEAGVRSVVKASWLLVLHHLLFFAIVTMVLWSQHAAVIGIGIVLDLFACHEAPLYVALLAYRLQWGVKLALAILYCACAWYVITRVMQTIILVYMIANFAGMPHTNRSYSFIFSSVVCGAFTIIQAYTLVIYWAMSVKLRKTAKAQGFEAMVDAPGQATNDTPGPTCPGSWDDFSAGDAALDIPCGHDAGHGQPKKK